jgi:negative regulator of replication initiation
MDLCSDMYSRNQAEFDRVLSLRGRRRQYFSRDGLRMKFPQAILNSGFFVETNLSANRIVKVCREMLGLFGYSPDQLSIERTPSGD